MVAAFLPMTMAQDNVQRTIVPVNASACETYTWAVNGQTYTNDTVVTFVNATDDTVFVLNLTINTPAVMNETILSDRCSYTWRGTTYSQSGVYRDTVFAAANSGLCDSIFSVSLLVSNVESDIFTVNTCGSYNWHGETYTTSGIYNDTTDNSLECTHIDVLNLSIVNTINVDENVAHCGDYTWHGETYTNTGIYTHTETDSTIGCDTLYRLNLTITVDTANMVSDSACASKTWRGHTYTTSGVYSVLDTNSTTHCVTYRAINLKIKPFRANTKDTAMTGCNNVVFTVSSMVGSTDKRFSQSTTWDTTFSDSRWAKCYDSTINLTVTVHKSGYDTTYANACDSFYWSLNKKTYYKTPETNPTYAFASDEFGCDSIMALFLKVEKAPVISAINGEWHLNAGDTAVLYPTCTNGATYTWTYGNITSHADTLRIPNVQGNIDVALEASINYPASNFTCYDTSWITIVTFVGINDVQGTNVSIYPNPTVGQLNIESAEAISEVTIFNALGQQVVLQHNLGNQSLMNLSNLSRGTYTMRISLENGENIVRKFVITK